MARGGGVARGLSHLSRTLLPELCSGFLKQGHDRCRHHGLQHFRAYAPTRLLLTKVKESTADFVSSPSTTAASYSLGRSFVNWYLGMLEAHPVLTKSVTAGSIFATADLTAQTITHKSSDSLDIIRTCRMAGYGMLISGPSLHSWFNFLSKILPNRDLVSTFKKMFLGQTVYGPIIATVFFSQNAALQGESATEIYARLKRDLIPTFINGLVYWPMCDFITFKFTPVRLQPLVSNSFSFVWTVYLTYMASLDKPDAAKISAG